MTSFLKRFFQPNAAPQAKPAYPTGPMATPDDIYFCYRLLLGREPEPQGLQSWIDWITNRGMPLSELLRYFIQGREFAEYFLNKEVHYSLLRAPIHLVEASGFKIYVSEGDSAVAGAVMAHAYENHVLAAFGNLLKPGDVVLDVGANIGYLSLAAAALVGASGRVIALEPNPENCLLMRSSMATNGFTQMEIHQLAAAAEPAAFVLEVDGSNGRMVPLELITASAARYPYMIFAQPIDTLLPDLTQLDLVKIDIEGAEPQAIEGMRKTLERHRPLIISEFSPLMIKNTSAIEPGAYLQQLRELGYTLSAIDETGYTPLPESWDSIKASYFSTPRSHIDILARPT